MAATITKAKVSTGKLAFWENLFDVEEEDAPKRYLDRGEQVTVIGTATVYGGRFGDKEYFKVNHHIYGLGYMRKEGLEVMTREPIQ